MAVQDYVEVEPPPSDAVDTVYPTKTTKSATSDWFREVKEGERKDIIYREVATDLVKEFKGGDDGNKYIFTHLPRRYQLFEHVKPNSKGEKGGERRDTYLFGRPDGKRFRSVAEFRPHLFHLAANTPEFADSELAQKYKVCSCKYCGMGGRPLGVGGASGGTARKPPTARKEADIAEARKLAAEEERLGEQETAGWVLRKGEVVWVWTGEEFYLDDVNVVDNYENWAAGVVITKPAGNTSLKKLTQAPTDPFAGLDQDETAPWEDPNGAGKIYSIQLCSKDGKGAIIMGVQQYFLRPWLARPDHISPPALYSGNNEHPSVNAARAVVQTFSVFDMTSTHPPKPPSEETVTQFSGVFLGAEKIFLGEPIRCSNRTSNSNDVMVISTIYTSTVPSTASQSKTNTVVFFRGPVYTSDASFGAHEVTPEQFASLPFRMRRGSGDGKAIKWYIRSGPNELGELSIRNVLGRWYEPMAVNTWGTDLARHEVVQWVANRATPLGLANVTDITLQSENDKKVPEMGILAAKEVITPDRGFKSINEPGSGSPGGMARLDRMMIDDEEEPLKKSPTKRLAFR